VTEGHVRDGIFIAGEVAEITGFLERDSSFVCASCLGL
jgi:hypothetical protein